MNGKESGAKEVKQIEDNVKQTKADPFLVCVYQGLSSSWMVEIEPHSYISSSRSVSLHHELVVNVDGVKGSASTGLYWELFNSREIHIDNLHLSLC